MPSHRIPGPICFFTDNKVIDEGTLCRELTPIPGTLGMSALSHYPRCNVSDWFSSESTVPPVNKDKIKVEKSGKYWVDWADKNAENSNKLDDLEASFKVQAAAFIKALENAGAKVRITTTKRSAKRAYLFHWSWKIALGKCKASDASKMEGVAIQWDHADAGKSKSAAQEMVDGFGLAVPPKSTVAPSKTSNHIIGKAIDLTITWTGSIKIKKKDGTEVAVNYVSNVNGNTALHAVGKSYGLIKHTGDAPHWSYNGR